MKEKLNKVFKLVFPTFLFSIITIIVNWDIVKHPLSLIEKNDGRLLAWTIAWDNHKILTDPFHIFQANIFFPNVNTLSYSEHFIGGSVLALPVYLLTGGNPAASFNFLLLLSFVLNSLSAFLLSKYLTKNWYAGIIAGVIFGFCSYKIFNIGHLQNLMIFYIPLMLLFLFKYKDTKQKKYIFLTALCLLMQSLTSWYHMAFIFLLFGIFVLYFLWKKYFNKKDLIRFAIAVAGVILIIIPFALPYFEFNKQNASAYKIGDLVEYSADFGGYLLPAPNSYLGSEILPKLKINKSDWLENFNFIGYIALALSILGAFTINFSLKNKNLSIQLNKNKGIFVIAGLIFFILSLGPVLHISDHATRIPLLYFVIYYILPPLRFIRAVARYSTVVFLMVAVLAGFGFTRILSRFDKKQFVKPVLLAVIVPLILLEYYPTHSYLEYANVSKTPEIYQEVKNNPDVKAILELPINVQPFETTKYIYYAGIHFKGLVNGYSGFEPKNYTFVKQVFTNLPDDFSAAYLKSLGVTHVLVNPTFQKTINSQYLDPVKSSEGYTLYAINNKVKDLNYFYYEFGADNSYRNGDIKTNFIYENTSENLANASTPYNNVAPVEVNKPSDVKIKTNFNFSRVVVFAREYSANDKVEVKCNNSVYEYDKAQSGTDIASQTFACNSDSVELDLYSTEYKDRAFVNSIMLIK